MQHKKIDSVWLNMESDENAWLKWAIEAGIDSKVIEFISTFPEYLNKVNEDDIRATQEVTKEYLNHIRFIKKVMVKYQEQYF